MSTAGEHIFPPFYHPFTERERERERIPPASQPELMNVFSHHRIGSDRIVIVIGRVVIIISGCCIIRQ